MKNKIFWIVVIAVVVLVIWKGKSLASSPLSRPSEKRWTPSQKNSKSTTRWIQKKSIAPDTVNKQTLASNPDSLD